MREPSSVHQRRRAPTASELAQIPWLMLLKPDERQQVEPQLVVSDPQPGDYVCRVGRPVTYWFGVVSGLLKMSSDNESGQTMTFTGVPPGGWFGEGTVLKRESYRYNIQPLRPSVVAGLPTDTFHWLIDHSLGFNRFIMNQLNERLGQFIAAREIDRITSPDLRVARNLAAPQVYVHRDFMPRNLMIPLTAGNTPAQQLGVLDFQDAVHGPITYDIASLMRDAFLSWEEDFVIDVTIRYWEKARKAGLMDFEDWHSDFGAFYRAVEWMGLQRHLKVAGIFARLTLRDGKPKYLADAPRFIAYIRATAHRYRELGPLLRLIDEVEGLQAASGFAFGRV